MNIEKFLMLDEITSVSDDRSSLTAYSAVPSTAPLFEEHFPDAPIFPGVLLTEVMAQAAGHLTMVNNNFEAMAILAKINKGKFIGIVQPGDKLRCEAILTKCERGFSLCDVRLFNNEQLCASAELRMKVLSFPTDNAKQLLIERHNKLRQCLTSNPDIEYTV
ncbi:MULTISPECIES: 3-hydroxyacyl-ACP dehydratase FabZ family protein [Pseudoalteromonas]|uniref:3-hydroxyacyl-ACP dehydratase FabZ family protein n=1 Tax=Pseudoalteromonas TaxID=53246 RepID=UPI000F7B42B6|nr:MULTISPECIES: 3-hydroxyacyl-ACP dehydratase FabZ family protein [Pseudoalteromonas]MCG7563249.1 beta-hydroxyacyl-ACP dehydratase [Pseudoalteromonas sp. McH1-42]MEC4090396.1 3-hydroxyacyl-ACP dehydratase FabZ family protein [Pseudoalteromonas rubra]